MACSCALFISERIVQPTYYYLSKEKLISNDVNEKTIDHLMSGVEAVTGGLHHHMLMDKIRKFDQDYIQTWLVEADVIDKMTLRLHAITMEDHYTRLYGPTIKAVRMTKKVHPPPPNSGGLLSREETRRQLKAAFSANLFEQYKTRSTSREELTGEWDSNNKVSYTLQFTGFQK